MSLALWVLRPKLVLQLTEIFQYRYLTNVPPDEQVWHKAFFRWVRAQDCGPDTPGSFKNASGPVGFSGDKPKTSPRRVKAWREGHLRHEELTVRYWYQTVRWKISARSRDLTVSTSLWNTTPFFTYAIPEVTWYEPLYNTYRTLIRIKWLSSIIILD